MTTQRRRRCSCCHELKHDTISRINPYAHEMYDDETKYPLCDECTDALRWDI